MLIYKLFVALSNTGKTLFYPSHYPASVHKQQHSPLQVVVFQPHVGIFGIPFCHDAVPKFPCFLHVLAMEGLRGMDVNSDIVVFTIYSRYRCIANNVGLDIG